MAAEYNINSQFTLLERAKRSVDGKRILPILDVMDKLGVPAFLQDVPYFQANQGLKHRIIRTNSRPTPTRRSFYQGVLRTALTTQVIYEPVILFEERVEIDEDHLDTIENPKEVRRQEVEAHIASLIEACADSIFNDAMTSGSEYVQGLAARMNILSYPGGSTTTLPYCWNNGGSATLSSVYLIEYGPKACHGLYPSGSTVRGSQFGIIARNKGKEAITETSSTLAKFYAYVTQLKKWFGLAVNDDRKITRVANINSTLGGSNTLNEDVIIQALNHGRFNRSRTRMYMNPYLKSQVDIRAKDKANVQWAIKDVFGEPIMTFQGLPIRVLDETILTASETAIA